jgi:glycolate oxidase iron-sulfur subunit
MELGPREPKGEIPLNAVYHDACHLCHAQQIRSQPRELLSLIPGLTLTPLAESEICCGAAGSYNLTEPEMADRLGQRKVKNILQAEPEAVITGNAGCSLQIQAVLKNKGEPLPVYHPVDLLDCSYRCAPIEDSH